MIFPKNFLLTSAETGQKSLKNVLNTAYLCQPNQICNKWHGRQPLQTLQDIV